MQKKKGKKRNIPAKYRYGLAVFAAAVIVYLAISAGVWLYERRPVTQVTRPESGQETGEEQLYVESEKKRFPLTLAVLARQKSPEEVEDTFDRAWKELSEGLKGENADLEEVTQPLYMPSSALDGEVVVSWSSDQPEYLSYDGTLGEKAPPGGIRIDLEAQLQYQGKTRVCTQQVRYVSLQDDSLEAQIVQAAEVLNQDSTQKEYQLPESYGEKPLIWYRKIKNPAALIALLVTGVGCLIPQRKKEQKKNEEKKYRARLLQQYPAFVSQMVLYMGAGMSQTQSFRLIAAGRKGQPPGILETECQILVRELSQGITESEAVHRLGERSGLWEYRAFCGLLIQNQSRGNAYLLPMLQAEAQKAFAERQRRARILGNEAGTRLLMPMMLLLLVVLMIVLFPAVTSFYT